MTNFLQKIHNKIQKSIHESNKNEGLRSMFPDTIVFDMCHNFSNNKKHNDPAVLSYFDLMVKKQFLNYRHYLYRENYKKASPQNKVLAHGMVFKAIFDTYMQYLKTSFDNVLFSDLNTETLNNRIIIDFIEYEKMPKHYHGMFVPYNKDHYVLNAPHANMVISFNKKNRKKLEKLLLRANILIPVIYKTTAPDINVGGILQIFESDPNAPAFNSSRKSDSVTDEQMSAISELHDIFTEISKITLPIATKHNYLSSAKTMYDEYTKNAAREYMFVKACATARSAQSHRDICIENAQKTFKREKLAAEQSYKDFHHDLIEALSNQIRTYPR